MRKEKEPYVLVEWTDGNGDKSQHKLYMYNMLKTTLNLRNETGGVGSTATTTSCVQVLKFGEDEAWPSR
jgi:hypothetical protein